MEDSLVCLRHCAKIVCKKGMEVCPRCGGRIDYAAITPPFHYPCPFVDGHASEQRLSVVFKPTLGSWVKACVSDNDLHIGVTDTDDHVVSYHWQGIVYEEACWDSVVVAYTVPQEILIECEHRWNGILRAMKNDSSWLVDCYDEDAHNCLDFVLAFLSMFCKDVAHIYGRGKIEELSFLEHVKGDETRQTFADLFVKPKLSEAVKYLTLCSEVETNGYATVT